MRNFLFAALWFAMTIAAPLRAAEVDWKKIDAIMGRSPAQSGETRRYGFPRSDLAVKVDGVAIKPALALGGWVAFECSAEKSVAMGDLVLTDAEVNPAISRLLAGGFEITALHNHLLRASPPTYYLHIAGRGDPQKLAETIRAALAATKTPLESAPSPASPPLDLDVAKIDEVIGAKGRSTGGVYQFAVPRGDRTSYDGMTVAGSMGAANVINFQASGAGKAAIAGDFMARANELDPLIRALRAKGVEIAAIHNHMLDEEPRLFFVHFWANDDALTLAGAMRSALDAVNAVSKGEPKSR
jgi:hypothetical protein